MKKRKELREEAVRLRRAKKAEEKERAKKERQKKLEEKRASKAKKSSEKRKKRKFSQMSGVNSLDYIPGQPIKLSPTKTILDLGKIEYKNKEFHTRSHIWPVGFKSKVMGPSSVDPRGR
eukprot:UN30311